MNIYEELKKASMNFKIPVWIMDDIQPIISMCREELKRKYRENGFKTKEFFDIIDEVLGESK